MTFQEAEEKLISLAGGKHCHIGYCRSTYADGDKVPECSLYIEGRGFFRGKTWRVAFEAMLVPAGASDPLPEVEG